MPSDWAYSRKSSRACSSGAFEVAGKMRTIGAYLADLRCTGSPPATSNLDAVPCGPLPEAQLGA